MSDSQITISKNQLEVIKKRLFEAEDQAKEYKDLLNEIAINVKKLHSVFLDENGNPDISKAMKFLKDAKVEEMKSRIFGTPLILDDSLGLKNFLKIQTKINKILKPEKEV